MHTLELNPQTAAWHWESVWISRKMSYKKSLRDDWSFRVTFDGYPITSNLSLNLYLKFLLANSTDIMCVYICLLWLGSFQNLRVIWSYVNLQFLHVICIIEGFLLLLPRLRISPGLCFDKILFQLMIEILTFLEFICAANVKTAEVTWNCIYWIGLQYTKTERKGLKLLS
jgi:hypothetical protein